MKTVQLAVNGTLMRGLALNGNLLKANARFLYETTTSSDYRLWTIQDRHPAMLRTHSGGRAIALEVWEVPAPALATILLEEPLGLSIGRVTLANGESVLGVLGEPALCETGREITQWGGWRAYMVSSEYGTS